MKNVAVNFPGIGERDGTIVQGGSHLDEVEGTWRSWIRWECVECGQMNKRKTNDIVETATNGEPITLECTCSDCDATSGLVEGDAKFGVQEWENWSTDSDSVERNEITEREFECPECDLDSVEFPGSPTIFLAHLKQEHEYSSEEASRVLRENVSEKTTEISWDLSIEQGSESDSECPECDFSAGNIPDPDKTLRKHLQQEHDYPPWKAYSTTGR